MLLCKLTDIFRLFVVPWPMRPKVWKLVSKN